MNDDLPSLETMARMTPAAAAALWAEHMQGEDEAVDEPLFRQWLAADEANGRAWQRVCAAWVAFEDAQGDEALRRMRAQALSFRPRRAVPRWLPFAAAASVVLAVGGTFAVRHGLPGAAGDDGVASPTRVQMAAYTTKVGQMSQVTLEDGTRLTLDTDSEVDVGFTGTARLARLVRGQAFFDVAHDRAHPFRVAVADRVITVLGTRFNMRLIDGSAQVMLVQGSIGVHRGSDPAAPQGEELERLVPGQVMVAGGQGADRVTQGDAEKAISWREGTLRFDSTTIGEAAKAFNRYSSLHLVVDDPQVADMRIGGTFRTDDSAGFARITAQLHGLRVRQAAGGNIILSR